MGRETKSGSTFQIQIHDPMEQGEGLNTYISYKIDTSQDVEFDSDDSITHSKLQVIRRFSDFLWLRETLIDCHPGCMVPVLPEKNIQLSLTHSMSSLVSSSSKQVNNSPLLDDRLQHLQLFLNRIASHPVLKDDAFFFQFLSLESDAFFQQRMHKTGKDTFAFVKLKDELQKIIYKTETSEKNFSIKAGDNLTFISSSKKLSNLEALSKSFYQYQQQKLHEDINISEALRNLSDSFSALSQRPWTEVDTTKSLGKFSRALESAAKLFAIEAENNREIEFMCKDFCRQTKGALIAVTHYKNIKNEYERMKKIINQKLHSINKADVDIEKETECLTKLKFQCSDLEQTLEKEIKIFNARQLQALKQTLRRLCKFQIKKHSVLAAQWRQMS